MRKSKQPAQQKGNRAISRRKFLGVTAGATAALSFGTFIRSGLGAAKLNILTWSNTLNAMDDTLREQAKQYTKEKGVEVIFEFVNQSDLPSKTAAAVESGAGPDIITTWSDGAHLFDKALIDVGDIAEPLGKQLKGWTNIGKDIGIVGKTWKAVPWGIIPIAIVYRTDWAKEAGYDKFPDTYDEMLVLPENQGKGSLLRVRPRPGHRGRQSIALSDALGPRRRRMHQRRQDRRHQLASNGQGGGLCPDAVQGG